MDQWRRDVQRAAEARRAAEGERPAHTRRARVAVLVLVVAVLVASVVLLVREGQARASCPVGRSAAPGGFWCPTYRQDFRTAVPVGGFTNATVDDWYLAPSNPYASSLRSYPDGWPTTGDLSLNLPSRTAEVVESVDGAQGVFRLSGRTEVVDGRPQALGGSFYPVIAPGAQPVVAQTSQLYGRYTVRFRTVGGFAPGPGGAYPTSATAGRFGTAFLLWPADDNWPDGEVDFPEMGWGDRIQGHVHTIGQPQITSADITTSASSATWNTAVIEWSPGLLVFGLNGAEVYRTRTDVPSVPMRWGFQSGGMLATPAPGISGQLLVDQVVIERYVSGPDAP